MVLHRRSLFATTALGLFLLVALAACGSAVTFDVSRASDEDAAANNGDPVEDATTPEDSDSVADVAAEEPAVSSEKPEPTPPQLEATPEAKPAAVAFTPVVFADDFSASVQPIFVENCASCHAEGGPGSVHWVLGTAQDLVDTHLLISSVLSTNYMPPWPASAESVDFLENRSLRADQLQAIADWSAAGAPLDIEASTPLPPPNGINRLANADRVVTAPNAYAGDPSQTDDYRCQIYDPELPDGGWVTGWEFAPDQLAVVHHAIGYLIPGSRLEYTQDLDGADGRPGWECFGSSGLGTDDLFLGWAPGQDATELPEGSGLWLRPGSFIVVQIHYHYEGDAPADLSTFSLTIADEAEVAAAGGSLNEVFIASAAAPVEIPCRSDEVGPLCDRDAAMVDAVERFGGEGVQANGFNRLCGVTPDDFAHFTDGVARSSCEIPAAAIGATGELISMLGHMHEIGDWMRLTLNPGTPDETVLLDIPDWDFDWQYNYELADPISLGGGDVIGVECGWDRARRDPALEPAYILWADGTNDEMCFATLTVVRDF